MQPSATSAALTTQTLWEALDGALPGRFPHCFQWECECGTSGFPGCTNISCLLDRVAIALLDYHQVQESAFRGERVEMRGHNPIAANPESFPRKRRKQYEADVALAIATLEAAGLKRQETT